jgi:hypothetical protein
MDNIQIRTKKDNAKDVKVELYPKYMINLLTREPSLIVRLSIYPITRSLNKHYETGKR